MIRFRRSLETKARRIVEDEELRCIVEVNQYAAGIRVSCHCSRNGGYERRLIGTSDSLWRAKRHFQRERSVECVRSSGQAK